MIYLLSSQGRGIVALYAVFLAAAFLMVGMAFSDDVAFFLFALGWFVSGIICFVLGRRWNRIADIHRFCTLRLQTWGIIYAIIGLFLMKFAWTGLAMDHHW